MSKKRRIVDKGAAFYECAVVRHINAWRVARKSDAAWVGRASGDDSIVREWATEHAAADFVHRLLQGVPIATMNLAWVAAAEDATTVPPWRPAATADPSFS